MNFENNRRLVFPVVRVGEIPSEDSPRRWLIESLWGSAAVGFLCGNPKSGKTWLGLDMALSVATDTPCLGGFRVLEPGRSLIYLAEDSLPAVRERVAAICRYRGLKFSEVDLHVIKAPVLRLDHPEDCLRLSETVAQLKPRLLLLDPLVRLHRLDENSSREVSGLLSHLRELQRLHGVAIILVHHARKGGASEAGEGLRGSIDFWAWGDSNLYMKRSGGKILLSMEHRSAPAPAPVALRLADGDGSKIHLELLSGSGEEPPAAERSLPDSVLDTLKAFQSLSRLELRSRLRVKNESLGEVLKSLEAEGRIKRQGNGWIVCENQIEG